MGKNKKGMQLTFHLPIIDSDETRRRVEEEMETVRIYRQIGFVRREIKSTPSYQPRYHSNTNAISKPVEDTAAWNVDKEAELQEKDERLERSISRLGRMERELIRRRYLDMEEDEVFDSLLAIDLGMSDRHYRRVKARAVYKLAFMLRLEVLIDPVSQPVAK